MGHTMPAGYRYGLDYFAALSRQTTGVDESSYYEGILLFNPTEEETQSTSATTPTDPTTQSPTTQSATTQSPTTQIS